MKLVIDIDEEYLGVLKRKVELREGYVSILDKIVAKGVPLDGDCQQKREKEGSITQFHAEFVEKVRLERKANELAKIEAEKAEAEAREKRLEEEREEQARIWWER